MVPALIASPAVGDAAFPPPVSPSQLSPLPGVCWQLSRVNLLMSSAPGEAEALK